MAAAKPDMYGISRIDSASERTHAWRVSLRRRGKRLVKNFTDRQHGGSSQALAAAQRYRDSLLHRYPPLSRRDFAAILRSNNLTGVSGVYRYAKRYRLKDGTQKESWYWEANWPAARGVSAKASFSVNRYGEDIARLMALQAREKGLAAVEGVFWASERGEIPPPTSAGEDGNRQVA